MDETQKSKISDWIAEAEKIKVPSKAAPRRTYDEGLVAFIDILGMTDLVQDKKRDAEDILTIMAAIQKHVGIECDKLAADNKLDYIPIGDGFIIVTGLGLINQLCEILSGVQWRTLIYSKMLMRGALTAGRVSVSQDDRLFVGPAIIDAYKFERENAIYPRIIFVNEIENYIAKTQINYTYIAVDQDKVKYLDFIKFNFDKEGLSKKTLDNLLTKQGIEKQIRNIDGRS